ncbi:MAG: amidohydrolase family protein [Aestuariivirga sp.]
MRGNIIEKISAKPIAVDKSATTIIINGDGKVLMPGLIDAHYHVAMSTMPVALMMNADFNYLTLRNRKAAEELLMQGFTAVRDVGGPSFGLKRAIDEGFAVGPRIWPSGATVGQTSGHGDFRSINDLPLSSDAPPHQLVRQGYTVIADGVDEVLRGTREQLMRGASQIKLLAGGGVSSVYDPLDVNQYMEEEIHAAVVAAGHWGTYVTVHAYTPESIIAAIHAGVKCIEHGQLADEEAVKLMAEKGIWWSLQPFLEDEDAIPLPPGTPGRAKQIQVNNGTDTAYQLAKKYKVKTAWGTDTLFDAKLAKRQGAQLAKLVRWFTPAEVLAMGTSANAELLALSGLRSPYAGKLGVVEEGALADLLLVNGDPIANIKLIEDPAKNFVVIMKDGTIYKNAM